MKAKAVVLGAVAIVAVIAACVTAYLGVKEWSGFLVVAVTFGCLASDS